LPKNNQFQSYELSGEGHWLLVGNKRQEGYQAISCFLDSMHNKINQ
ncbi:MAG: hypothetical protein JNK65_01120, partial [Deltaproteobacteria bacterium]|nr:hypothetical protein [Deltaproteobacteria bacterium]